jgi:hypothetical protein
MSSELSALLRALDAIRLRDDWTWAELSADMDAAHAKIPPRTLHHLVKHADTITEPHDRTIYKLKTYLAYKKEMARRQRVRKMNAAAKKSPDQIDGRGV